MPVAEYLDQPFDQAISFLRQKTNVTTKSWLDIQGAAHSRMFMVAGAASDALVEDFRREIDKALAEGTTLEDFRKGFDAIVAKHGWDHTGDRNWRSRVIFETNLRTAHAAGRYAELTSPGVREAFPFWQYQHSGAVHPRRQHLAWDGLTLSADDAFWDTNYPPNGFGCGCFVVPASKADLERQGKSTPDRSPDLRQADGTLAGVDQSFAYNPGRDWLNGARPGAKPAGNRMLKHFAAAAVARKISERATIPLTEVPKDLSRRLKLPDNSLVGLSAESFFSHLKNEISIFDYARLAKEVMVGPIYRDAKGRFAFVTEIGGKPYVVGLKITRNRELVVTTIHRSRTQRAALIRMGEKVW